MSPASYQTALPRDVNILFSKMAEEQGFEPWLTSQLLPVFKTGPFNHLGIPPYKVVDPVGLEPTTTRL